MAHIKYLNELFNLGYANAKIYKCDNPKCPRPGCYISGSSSKDDSFPCLRPACSGRFQLVRHVSFVDCPGHDILMATMLNGAAVMDAALLLIAGKHIVYIWSLNSIVLIWQRCIWMCSVWCLYLENSNSRKIVDNWVEILL